MQSYQIQPDPELCRLTAMLLLAECPACEMCFGKRPLPTTGSQGSRDATSTQVPSYFLRYEDYVARQRFISKEFTCGLFSQRFGMNWFVMVRKINNLSRPYRGKHAATWADQERLTSFENLE